MKFLLVAQNHKNSFLLQQLAKEGHEVQALVQEHTNGTTPTVPDIETATDWGPDVAIFDIVGYGNLAKVMKDKGIHVLGGSLLHDTLDSDPEYMCTLASRVRVPIFPMDKEGKPTVWLAGFFSRKGFCGPAFSYVQDRGLLSPVGPVERCSVTVLPEEDRLVQKTFKKLEKLFGAFNLAGLVTLEVTMLSGDDVAHVHSMRFGAPEGFWPAWMSGLTGELGKVLHGIASGKVFTIQYNEDVNTAVKVTVPPYPVIEFPWLPVEEQGIVAGRVLRGAVGHPVAALEENVYWVDVNKTDDGYVTAGPEVAWVVGKERHKTIAALNLPQAQYKQGPLPADAMSVYRKTYPSGPDGTAAPKAAVNGKKRKLVKK